MTAVPCALCGSSDVDMISGRTGRVCVRCLGEAARSLIAKDQVNPIPTLTASKQCLLCGDSVAKGTAAAVRAPYAVCRECIIEALAATGPGEAFLEVKF